jgi:hypothetical protein
MDPDGIILVGLVLVLAAIGLLVGGQAWRHWSDNRRIRRHLRK